MSKYNKIKIEFSSETDSSSRSRSSSSSSSSSSSRTSVTSYSDSFSDEDHNGTGKDTIKVNVTINSSDESFDNKPSKSNEHNKSNNHNTKVPIQVEKIESEKIPDNLPFNVYQILFSLKNSALNITKLKNEFEEKLNKIQKLNSKEEKEDLKLENEKLFDQIVKESASCIPLIKAVYGSTHWRVAHAYTNLALIYLDYGNMAKQAKHHCENAYYVLVEDLKDQTKFENQSEENKTYEFLDPDYNKHQMILNYVHGRSSIILKENDEQEESGLIQSEEYLDKWEKEITNKPDLKPEMDFWKQKIYLAIAKKLAISGKYKQALEYYDKCIDFALNDDFLLIQIFTDKSNIEFNQENHLKSIDLAKDSVKIAERIGSHDLIQKCKLSLAKIYSNLDDLTSSEKAEDLFKELNTIESKDEYIKFLIKQSRLNEAYNQLLSLLEEKKSLFGDFSLKLNPTLKLLCSVLLKLADMPQAAKYLKNSLDIEELNYGKQDKRCSETRQNLEDLKKNPNVKVDQTSQKPLFNSAVKRIDYNKSDQKLYSIIKPLK